MRPEDSDVRPFSHYFDPVVRFLPLIVLFCTSAALSSLALTYLFSEKYVGSAIVLVRPHESVAFQPKERNALGYPIPLASLESIANTVEDVVKGEAVLAQIVQTLRLDVKVKKPAGSALTEAFRTFKDAIKEFRDDTWEILRHGRILPKDNFRGAMLALRKNIAIKRTNKAYTFRLEVVDEDPVRAAQIVNTAGAILSDIIYQERMKNTQLTRANLETRLAVESKIVHELRASVDQFKRTSGIASLPQEVSLRLKSMNTIEDELATIQADISAVASRRAQVTTQLKETDSSVKYTVTTSDNLVFNELRSERAKLEVERAGLLEKLTPENKEVRAIEAKLQETEARLAKESPKLVSSESTRLSDLHTKLLSEKLAADAELQALDAKKSTLVRTLSEQSRAAQQLTNAESSLNDLTLRLGTAEKSYQLIADAYEEAVLAESKTVRELILQSPALIPSEPAKPIKILHVSVAFLLSLALALGTAFVVDFLQSKVHSIRDAEKALGLPVFGTIPLLDASTGQPQTWNP